MKKIASILLLMLLLFNWFGYRLLTFCLEENAGRLLNAQIDRNNYLPSELITLKIPVNMPYYQHTTEYERVEGEIEIGGRHYNYVKRRLYNDSIEFVCIPNNGKTQLRHSSDEFFKSVNDLRQTAQNKKSGVPAAVCKQLLTEYCQQSTSWSFGVLDFVPEAASGDPRYYLHSLNLLPQEQPPDLL